MESLDDQIRQAGEAPGPGEQDPDVIVSQDTRRTSRLPPGQSRTRVWPVLDAFGTPEVDLSRWRLTLGGLVERPVRLDWQSFCSLPAVRVFSDFHCVTRWSRLGNLWTGVATTQLAALAGVVRPQARFVLIGALDGGWTTNLPIDDFLAPDSLMATHHDGRPLLPEHGGPARLIVPHLYAWKSAKWVTDIQFLAEDRPGFWERNGYHRRGDPWTEERFGV
jgi:DMSO/TMAO reductase YedYZ molybdopterin-dependent catalytic subunit